MNVPKYPLLQSYLDNIAHSAAIPAGQMTDGVMPAGEALTVALSTDPFILDVAGTVDLYTHDTLKEVLDAVVATIVQSPPEQHPFGIIVDARDVTYMDSSGYGLFLAAQIKLRRLGKGDVLVIVMTKCGSVERFFRLAALDKQIDVYGTAWEAVAALPRP